MSLPCPSSAVAEDAHKPLLGSNTSSGGNNWVGYLTAAYNESLVLNYNLAVGGATIDNDLVDDEVKDMTHQVADFKSKYGAGPWDPDNTLLAFWIGINEYCIQSLHTHLDLIPLTQNLQHRSQLRQTKRQHIRPETH